MEKFSEELLEMSAADQAMRFHAQETGDWDDRIDKQNIVRLKEIVTSCGWPSITQNGLDVSVAAWILVQHADAEPEFQAHCLLLMKQLPEGEVRLREIAYLEDRVRVNTGKPQLYGTQFYREGDTFAHRPIEDEDNLEKRRAEIGLEPLAENMARVQELDTRHHTASTAKSR